FGIRTQLLKFEHLTVPEDKDSHDDFNILQLNTKVKYIIICTLSKSKYIKFCSYKTIKEMWYTLRITHGGIGDVKQLMKCLYDFKLIFNGLQSLWHELFGAQKNLKILESLSNVWDLRASLFKSLTLTLDELFRALKLYEVHLFKRDKIKDNDYIPLKVGDLKHRCIEKYGTDHKGKILKMQLNCEGLGKSSSGSKVDEVSLMFKKVQTNIKEEG
ncbi:hypothetical protein CR513_43912, partial [Mucuna pruriens]